MSNFKYFKIEEFDCQETGENAMQDEFIHALDSLREACGFSFTITSGYRSPKHSIEAKKAAPGMHSKGIAADIRVSGGAQRFLLAKKAFELGFSGIGVAKTFVHVDTRNTVPVLWIY
jgi:zinc D-Ala-D-Ala carboxypeptidase